MLKDNLIMLRGLHGYSQEQIAEKINISRQAYAKWESGATVPDIEKCSLLAEIYGTTIDSLVKGENCTAGGTLEQSSDGKCIYGSVTVNERGQIVIPKAARDKFGLVSGQRLIVLSDDVGIALVKSEIFEDNIKKILEMADKNANDQN